ncbi:MAG: homogentisate 1,2-dioxygenase [Calditrichaeota bacterium]|nr:homogentisate 1,2-dioxygenase [Candidatus Cloacimonadota bacterium]MCB1046723.1 homogentisate 1,2-dioxygenase [Calditrichota bacterium]
MPFYHRLGKLPHKRHTVFKRPDGTLYQEELMGNKGFTGLSSLLYHERVPTAIREARVLKSVQLEEDPDPTLRQRHLRAGRLACAGSVVLDRVPVLFNDDICLSLSCPDRNDEFFYRNATADECVYVSDGEGVLESLMGELPFRRGDYVVIPRGILHRWRFAPGVSRLLVMESAGYIRTPSRYRSEHGQLLEHSPFCERDIRVPMELPVHDEAGDFPLVIKGRGVLSEVIMASHPLDVAGWDGYYYPWAFNIEDFEPITGRIHQPPPVHQTFEGDGFVICSFVPRLYDYHPESIPAPYNHSNVMTDEVLYYAKDSFMSRRGIEYASITLHPDGLVHGPHPGKMEESVGKQATDELAVMIDTFRPLKVSKQALEVEDKDYMRSWL